MAGAGDSESPDPSLSAPRRGSRARLGTAGRRSGGCARARIRQSCAARPLVGDACLYWKSIQLMCVSRGSGGRRCRLHPPPARRDSGCERRSPPPAAADPGVAVRAVRACRCTGTGWAGPHRALPIVPSIAAASVLADSKITIRKARECVRIAAGIRAWSVLRDAL